ncbi:putative toxin-antitoxin system toxin component, PIN family [Candidatus Aerophobetes bacterium]|nr:putative toxin-antitoxin system toxin component, PIN family [Candidatus Aerophobetes bacterium]
MLKAVYDTNIIVSAALHKDRLPASLLSLALKGKVKLFVSDQLLQEYEGVLKRPKFKLGEKEIEDLIKLIKEKAIRVKPAMRLTRIKNDLADNRVLECALEAGVDFIVTGNKKHFPFERFHKIKVVNPREFATYFMIGK